eukprot:TRINITY_DN106800_c0_g1_i1.p1 TRINITY_DN106800_c0_g1~~TRINITY_DN106800_c0_g1_i1.p1  ORF type:complete len:375 (-),score=6.63 TRINITY_DN106800_c0_g1_i1:58-1182(-)
MENRKICKKHLRNVEFRCTVCCEDLCWQCYITHSLPHAIHHLNPAPNEINILSLDTESSRNKFTNTILKQTCHYDLNLLSFNLWVYDLQTKDCYGTKLLIEGEYKGMAEFCAVDTRIFYIFPSKLTFENVHADLAPCLMSLDLLQTPLVLKVIHKFQKGSGPWTLCQVRNSFIYLLSKKGLWKYQIKEGKLMKIPAPNANNSFLTRPLVFQDRYILAIQEQYNLGDIMITWNLLRFDILDEEQGWTHMLIIKQNRLLLLYTVSQAPILILGSNCSAYYVDTNLAITEYFLDPNNLSKSRIIVDKESLKGLRMHPIMGTPTYYKGNAWFTESRYRDLVRFSYISRRYKGIRSKTEFKQYRLSVKHQNRTIFIYFV